MSLAATVARVSCDLTGPVSLAWVWISCLHLLRVVVHPATSGRATAKVPMVWFFCRACRPILRQGSSPCFYFCPMSCANQLGGSWPLCSLCFGGPGRTWQPCPLPTCTNCHPSLRQHLAGGATLPPGSVGLSVPFQAHSRHSGRRGWSDPTGH